MPCSMSISKLKPLFFAMTSINGSSTKYVEELKIDAKLLLSLLKGELDKNIYIYNPVWYLIRRDRFNIFFKAKLYERENNNNNSTTSKVGTHDMPVSSLEIEKNNANGP